MIGFLQGLGERHRYLGYWLARRTPRASRIRLDRRLIFIMPTRVGLFFFMAQLLMLLAAINYQNSLAYAVTFLLLSLSIVTILHTWRNLVGLELQAANVAPVFVGGQAMLGLRLESTKYAHRAIALGWSGSEMQLQEVAACSISNAELQLPALARGWLQPGRLRVESRFPLGIFMAWSWVDLEISALVYPRPLSGELPCLSGKDHEDETDGSRAEQAGVDDYRGLRPWQPGDAIRRLDWKAYSRGRGLLVKDFVALTGTELVLDFGKLSGDIEARLSLLCHWVLELDSVGQIFTLVLPGQTIGPNAGQLHREVCLRALALFGSGKKEGQA
ncbi:uncharacterized protein (DUF58 family) [Azomonas macrocytogenes]|uniref:Uncharacterized protein (DUF58 family) n=2 Tax=Azomonas macrocytogenes TaxID=69962 RepID=A0A839T6F0_AZOMA|nr:DUF58 domain-containing protein [Azomonas macrocytogenes]MBB3104420.1 uncharacterized protein (DUF58 family) [Azomonas macrocytogenes]